MKKVWMIIGLLFVSFLGHAQNDAKAVKILDNLSAQLHAYKNIYAEFKYNLINKDAGVTQETKGRLSIEGNKFHAVYMGVDDIFDGQKRYQVIHENEEVNVVNHKDDDAFTPNQIFSFYNKGYQQKMDIKKKVGGRIIQYIRLIPKNSDVSEKFVLLGIDVKANHIHDAILTEKNGSLITLEITKFITNQVMPSKLFQFQKDKYPEYYINELD